jgi:hypothetical protein
MSRRHRYRPIPLMLSAPAYGGARLGLSAVTDITPAYMATCDRHRGRTKVSNGTIADATITSAPSAAKNEHGGRISVLDRRGLEERTRECYVVVK